MNEKAANSLQALGFSAYEAGAYLALLREKTATGYQISRVSGIPRSRVYETLERLVAKGYAVILQAEPVQYAPLEAKQLLERLQERFDGTVSSLETELENIGAGAEPESIWNLQGQEAILKRAQAMIGKARESIYLVAWAQLIHEVQPGLEAAIERGVRVLVISCGEITGVPGIHYSHAMEGHIVCQDDSSINLVMDGAEVLLGETRPADRCRGAWSRNGGLIHITEEYIRHEVYLHKIIGRLKGTAADELGKAFVEGLQEVPHRKGTS
jgi:sugar-specific transcriptional regulator TrmB